MKSAKQMALIGGVVLGLGFTTQVMAGTVAASGSYGGSYFEVVQDGSFSSGDETTSWEGARTAAQASSYNGVSGDLVSITSAGEGAFITSLFAGIGGEYWSGGFQNPITEPVATAGWTWVDGQTFPGDNGESVYANWASGEPNDAGTPGSEQYLGLNLEGPGAWNDEGNSYEISGYVVEYSSVPDGGMTASLLGGALVGLGALRRKWSV
jgi:hypothetical protein